MHTEQKNSLLPLLQFLPAQIEGALTLADLDLETMIATKAPFGVARFSVAPGETAPVDSHASHEIWVITEGEGELLYEGRVIRLLAEDACYIEPPKPHQLRNTGATMLWAISIWWR